MKSNRCKRAQTTPLISRCGSRLFSGAIKLSNPCEGMKHCPELERLLRAGGGCAWRGIRWRRGVDNDDGQTRGSPPSIKA